MNRKSSHLVVCLALAIFASSSAGARQARQRPGAGVSSRGEVAGGTITVYIRDENGAPLRTALAPKINLTSSFIGFSALPIPQTTGSGWTFSDLAVGRQYNVEVKLDGYEDGHESVELPDMDGASATVMVFMKRANPALVFRAPTGQFVLTPKAQREVQAALHDLREGRHAPALKHAEKALQLAPGNPYVQYVMGMALVLTNQLQEAKPHLEQAVSIDPKQPPALLALGTLRYRLGDDAGAIEVLTRDIQIDQSSWQAEWILANSYLRERKFKESREHAEHALKAGDGKANQVTFVLAQDLAALGERAKAAEAFEEFAREFPKDPSAVVAQREAENLRNEVAKPAATSSALAPPSRTAIGSSAPPGASAVAPMPAFEVPPSVTWAPPDVDAVKPSIEPESACVFPDVLKSAEARAEEFVNDLEKFSATEDYEATEFAPGGGMGRPISRQYSYLVLIDTTSPKLIQVQEVRGKESEQIRLPGRLQDLGAPTLALAFHRTYQDDFEWTCEGLGKWRGQPAWVVHFQQRSDRPTSLLSSFGTISQQYALPLKGRAWVAQSGGEVLHLDTDLMKPLVPVDLMREHFSINYAPVEFRSHHVQLWLPEDVDTYIQYQGHFLHHYHHFSNFKLFWVGATQQIGQPKDTDDKR